MPTTGHKARTAPGGKQVTWIVPGSLETVSLFEELAEHYTLQHEHGVAWSRTWFDTDDWRLYRKNMLLFIENDKKKWSLVHRKTGEMLATYTDLHPDHPHFAWDFPVSRMRSLLDPVTSIRTLRPMLSQDSSTSCYCILNQDSKTIARVYIDEHVTPETMAVNRLVTLKGVRGYDNRFDELRGFFVDSGIRKKASFSVPLDQGMSGLTRQPLDYSSKFSIRLDAEMPAREAMTRIYQQLLETMEHNIQGVVEDLDTEFLHDFRVAIRRTRSGLGQVKDVLPEVIVNKAKKDFAWLGSVTGPTRDLDVYLLEREQYMERLPQSLRPCLDYFFVDIALQREQEQQQLVTVLRSQEFTDVLTTWCEYLGGPGTYGETKKSGKTIGVLAREVIFSKYRKILKDGGAIKRSSPDEDLHRLRIQCKKLRYLLEFFSSLFLREQMKLAIKQLKQLQDNLGVFNDLSVQQEMLQQYLGGLKPGTKKNQQLATAIGGLLTTLYHEQQSVRQGFYTRYHQFSCEENQQLYAQLFH